MMPACELVDQPLVNRVIGEYLEMPGLCLTIPQARRLWNIDLETCVRVLEALRCTGFLCRSGDTYIRANLGRHAA